MKRPNEADYTSQVAYTRALEEYCDTLAQPAQEYHRGYADAMNWKVQNHLEHLPPKEPEQDGWILVPVTLTNDMTSAMADALEDPDNERSSWDLAENMWRAMLTKAPTPPAQPAQEPYNFCPRCGKRLEGVLGRPQMHTCTPPLWGHT